MTTIRRIIARYDDRCRVCGCVIRPGDRIWYGGRCAISHETCGPIPTAREATRAPDSKLSTPCG